MKKETGRSMIEMLGVLAIIGMLSLVGISVYKRAITRHQTNNLIEDVRLAGFIVADEMFSSLPAEQEEVFMAGKFAPESPYTFTAFKESDITFAVVADKVSFPVCEEARKRKVDWLEEIRPNGFDNVCKKEENNAISFFFNSAFNTQMSELGENKCRGNRDCPSDKPYCCANICSACPCGQIKTIYGCYTCEKAGSPYVVSDDMCHVCDNTNFRFFAQNIGSGMHRCKSCTSVDTVKSSERECDYCEQRCYNQENQTCALVTNPEMMRSKYCTEACPENYYMWGLGGGAQLLTCRPCSSTLSGNHYVLDYNKCHVCPDTLVHEVGDNILRCGGCLSTSSFRTTKSECDRCTKRYWVERENDNPFGDCNLCSGTVSSDGTQCITN
ncbi:MAG: Tfp pilus assembly protein FimT/FimU [Alphaproteobacteria bacterium]